MTNALRTFLAVLGALLMAIAAVASPDVMVHAIGETAAESSPDSESMDRAVEEWNFSGYEGVFEASAEGGRWFAFAFPVWEGMGNDSFRAWQNVTVAAGTGEAGEGRFYLCAYLAPRLDGLAKVPFHMPSCYFFGGDVTYEYTVDILGERVVDEDVYMCLHPVICEEQVGTAGTKFSPNSGNWAEFLRRSDRPVAHYIIWSGPHEPIAMDVKVRWSDTIVAVNSGPYEDVFTHQPENFRSTLYARGDFWASTYVQYGAEFESDLNSDGNRTTMFAYAPGAWRTESGDLDAGVVHPNGTVYVHDPPQSTLMMADNDTRPWRFWYDLRAGVLFADAPILHGLNFEWATLPWEE